jgi:hypothetical protein
MPWTPKSGEHDDQVAPIQLAASIPVTASGMFGSSAATRSPGRTPSFSRAAASLPASACRGGRSITRRSPSSPRNRIASRASGRCSRFSAKFSRARGNQRAPGIAAPFSNTAPGRSPITLQKSHRADQKAARCSTDQRHRAS